MERTGKLNAIGDKTKEIAELWRDFYNMPDGLQSQEHLDAFFSDGDTFKIGNLTFRAMLSPGHTLGSITYVASDAAFAHDTSMFPDGGELPEPEADGRSYIKIPANPF